VAFEAGALRSLLSAACGGGWPAREVAEHRLCVGERGGEDLLGYGHQLRDARVADSVVDVGAFAAALERSLFAQRGEVLGGAARVEGERVLQVADGPLPVAQEFEDPDADGVTEHFEQLRLAYVDGV
jgi:hypothetical protein